MGAGDKSVPGGWTVEVVPRALHVAARHAPATILEPIQAALCI